MPGLGASGMAGQPDLRSQPTAAIPGGPAMSSLPVHQQPAGRGLALLLQAQQQQHSQQAQSQGFPLNLLGSSDEMPNLEQLAAQLTQHGPSPSQRQ